MKFQSSPRTFHFVVLLQLLWREHLFVTLRKDKIHSIEKLFFQFFAFPSSSVYIFQHYSVPCFVRKEKLESERNHHFPSFLQTGEITFSFYELNSMGKVPNFQIPKIFCFRVFYRCNHDEKKMQVIELCLLILRDSSGNSRKKTFWLHENWIYSKLDFRLKTLKISFQIQTFDEKR